MDDILLYIFQFVGFGDGFGKNIVSMQRISHQFYQVISNKYYLEVDTDKKVLPKEFAKKIHLFYILWKQKRDEALEWDSYRKYIIITDFNCNQWLYYSNLMSKYRFEQPKNTFPYFKGKMFLHNYI